MGIFKLGSLIYVFSIIKSSKGQVCPKSKRKIPYTYMELDTSRLTRGAVRYALFATRLERLQPYCQCPSVASDVEVIGP